MAFEEFYKIQFVVAKSNLDSFRDYLHTKGVVHLKDISNLNQSLPPSIDKSTKLEIDNKLSMVEYLLQFIEKKSPVKSSFMENFIPYRPVIMQEEVNVIDNTFDPTQLFQEVQEKDKEFEQLLKDNQSLFLKMTYIHCLKRTGINFSKINAFNHISFKFYISNDVTIEELTSHPFIEENAIIVDYRELSPAIRIHMVICSKKVEPELDILLKKFGLTDFDISSLDGTPEDVFEITKRDLNIQKFQFSKLEEFFEQTIQLKEKLLVLKDLLSNQKERNTCIDQFAQTKHAVYIEGFIPKSNVESFEQQCNQDYPKVLLELFPTDEPAPIKFKNNSFFKPFEFIIKMFGFPRYGMIDPTPFVTICFLILFGLSFGDVIYGLLVVLFCWWGIRKYEVDRGAVNFFKIFLFAGISSTFFGAITNSWAGDLVSSTYMSKNNFLVKLKDSMVLMDPVKQIMTYMVIVLYLGLVIQMLGVLMAFMQNIKEKNIKDAIFD
jgi:V/A-type H+-transporting ATPase subunit I